MFAVHHFILKYMYYSAKLKESASHLDEALQERDELTETCAELKQQMVQVKNVFGVYKMLLTLYPYYDFAKWISLEKLYRIILLRSLAII